MGANRDISSLEIERVNLSCLFVKTCGGDRVTHRYINYRGFELTENFFHRGIENSEMMRLDQGHPSVGDTWQRSVLSGEVPIEGQIGALEFGIL